MNRKLIVSAIAVAALATGGTAAAFADDGPSDSGGGTATQQVAEAKVTAQEAADTAGGTVTSVELEDERDSLVWEVESLGKDDKLREFVVDADSGKVLDKHLAQDDDGDDDRDDDGKDDADDDNEKDDDGNDDDKDDRNGDDDKGDD